MYVDVIIEPAVSVVIIGISDMAVEIWVRLWPGSVAVTVYSIVEVWTELMVRPAVFVITAGIVSIMVKVLVICVGTSAGGVLPAAG